MSNRSRRSVLEQIGLVLGASVGVGSVRAFDDGDAYDALEEMRDVLLDLERELSRAEDQLEDLDNASGFGGFDDPDFGGIDGDDPPAEILDDVGDDVVINDIPVSRMVPLNGTNNTDAREFDRTVRVNGVKVGIAKNGTQASESGTRDPPEGPESDAVDSGSRSEVVGLDRGNDGDGPDTADFGGFDPSPDPDDGDESASSPGSGGSANDTVEEGVEVLTEVREMRTEASNTLDELETGGWQTVERELRRTRQLLTHVRTRLDVAERKLSSDWEAAVETTDSMTERVEERIDIVEDAMGELDTDVGF